MPSTSSCMRTPWPSPAATAAISSCWLERGISGLIRRTASLVGLVSRSVVAAGVVTLDPPWRVHSTVGGSGIPRPRAQD